jgi:hypothetical protein
MTAPRKPEPLTEEELASLVLDYCDGLEQSALDGMTRLFATLDATRERLAAVERERDEARAEVAAVRREAREECVRAVEASLTVALAAAAIRSMNEEEK